MPRVRRDLLPQPADRQGRERPPPARRRGERGARRDRGGRARPGGHRRRPRRGARLRDLRRVRVRPAGGVARVGLAPPPDPGRHRPAHDRPER
ncbi:hypothetical protein E1285_32925 [Actinomadura sp. 7K507]|nr:hypothetical protein E1285_32925 [Actinomadura sp. 7K507]